MNTSLMRALHTKDAARWRGGHRSLKNHFLISRPTSLAAAAVAHCETQRERAFGILRRIFGARTVLWDYRPGRSLMGTK